MAANFQRFTIVLMIQIDFCIVFWFWLGSIYEIIFAIWIQDGGTPYVFSLRLICIVSTHILWKKIEHNIMSKIRFFARHCPPCLVKRIATTVQYLHSPKIMRKLILYSEQSQQ
jgi:hypothetical protein